MKKGIAYFNKEASEHYKMLPERERIRLATLSAGAYSSTINGAARIFLLVKILITGIELKSLTYVYVCICVYMCV